ncbi:MAG: hypothetical protein ACO3VJ_06430, partial [Ilumatobacteraceae bacterium]
TEADHSSSLRRLSLCRGSSPCIVCQLLAKRVPGVQVTTTVAISGEVQVSDRTSTQAAIPLRLAARDLSRRVLVVARPGRL